MSSSAEQPTIKAVILDVDGVLTDGRIGYAGDGQEIKFFDVKDGHAIKLLRRAGLKVGLLSGRASKANSKRAQELELDFVYQGEKDKGEALERLLREQQLQAEDCLYMGDDVVDMPVMKKVAISVATGDAVDEVKELALWTTESFGGCGAVREMAVRLLKQQNQWDQVMSRYR
jgi:3-deoxy-D-manno-octulosonate 8-phosphate phosphatase (KDO 8-P phosphatase)